MGQDEVMALEILDQNRRLHERHIKANNGTLIKEMGDGNLVHFSSALDAVLCAKGIQEDAANELNGKLRIGIHLDEVVIKDKDVFGDGVNIASRIQEVTDAGGVYLSESVQKAIRNRTDLSAVFLAETALKNVDYPIRIYRLSGNGLPVTPSRKVHRLAGTKPVLVRVTGSRIFQVALAAVIIISIFFIWKFQNSPKELRIAILPIENLSTADQGQYISAGLHSELIDEISKIGSFIITSRTSSLKYRNQDKSIPEIANELNVNYIVESELFDIGDSLRIKVRLISAQPQEKLLWRHDYNRPTKDISAVYGDIALSISQATNAYVSDEDRAKLTSINQVNPDAYKAYLTGIGHLYEFSQKSVAKAIQYFDLALSIDDQFAPAHLGISLAWAVRMQFGYLATKEARPKILEAADKALAIDNSSPAIHYNRAIYNTWVFWDWENAESEFLKTIEMAPQHAEAHAYYAHFLNTVNRNKEANAYSEKAVALQPANLTIRTLYGMHLNHSYKFKEATQVLQEVLKENPNYGMGLSSLWTVYHNSGQIEEAAETAKLRYAALGENEVVDILINNYVDHGYHAAMEKIAEALMVKKDTSHVTPWQIATLFVRAGNKEKSLYWLEEAYKVQDPNMPYISTDPIFDNIRQEERFQRLLTQMKLD